jgi:glycosyltransferase involved in cell wall biosynthesis
VAFRRAAASATPQEQGEQDLTIDVSVVICTYTEERWNVLSAAIDSVRLQSVAPREIVVVVDHNEPLVERLQARWPDLRIVRNHEQRGLSGARNTGVASSDGDVVAFLDDDAMAEPDWLERILDVYARDGALAVGGAIEGAWDGEQPGWFPEEFAWVVGCSYRGLPTVRGPVRNVIGANMSVKREAFKAVGGFHAHVGRMGTLPFGCEETELCVRIGKRWPGPVVVYDPAIRVRHHVTRARAGVRYFLARCYAEGRSKAIVAALAGERAVLRTEAAYATRVLPAGVLREVTTAFREQNAAALARAGAIMIGLATTTAGFVAGALKARLAYRDQ